ncbi:hypothetical protein BN946_scf184942.g87 [Trametes cinnabarina]|uniref:Uncharacterized protein n=1 Tax=Pycnoporus cinnabarinus TaxID=5643 RepID=A0A060S770_PYCCI|nr:hypothetical protein BN946_scf184942.g87 [Trametes cinnabarina]
MAQNPAVNRASIVAATKDAVGSTVPYALVGGAACLILSSTRLTEDVDVVVPSTYTPASRDLLKAAGKYTISDRKDDGELAKRVGCFNHTVYGRNSAHSISIL